MRATQLILFLGLTILGLGADAVRAADAPNRANAPVPMKVQRYARYAIETRDVDGDGLLSQEECGPLTGELKIADRDRDRAISATELAEYIARYGRRRKILLMPGAVDTSEGFPSLLRPEEKTPKDKKNRLGSGVGEQASTVRQFAADAESGPKKNAPARRFTVSRSRLPAGLPSWFRSLDRNGDGQLTLAEFSRDGDPADIEEYAQYDLNGDGLLTADEYVRASSRPVASRLAVKAELPAVEDEELDALADAEVADKSEIIEPADEKPKTQKSLSAKEKAKLKKLNRPQRSPK